MVSHPFPAPSPSLSTALLRDGRERKLGRAGIDTVRQSVTEHHREVGKLAPTIARPTLRLFRQRVQQRLQLCLNVLQLVLQLTADGGAGGLGGPKIGRRCLHNRRAQVAGRGELGLGWRRWRWSRSRTAGGRSGATRCRGRAWWRWSWGGWWRGNLRLGVQLLAGRREEQILPLNVLFLGRLVHVVSVVKKRSFW